MGTKCNSPSCSRPPSLDLWISGLETGASKELITHAKCKLVLLVHIYLREGNGMEGEGREGERREVKGREVKGREGMGRREREKGWEGEGRKGRRGK